jgi:hypothetical protein
MSMPAATPEDVQRSRSWTQRAFATQVTSSPWLDAHANVSLFEVARYPA